MVTLVNRAKMNTSTTGTGTITLGSAKDGFQSFADAGVADGDVVRYVIEDGDSWEIGLGTYTSSGTTLTRQVLESSVGGSAINLSGDASVFVAASGADLLSQPKSTVNDGQLDFSSSSYFKTALTADTFFEPVNMLTGETAQTALLEVSGSTITRNSDVNNAEPERVQLNLSALGFSAGFSATGVFQAARFSPDGTRLFVAEDAFGPVSLFQLDLATAFDLSTASYSGVSLFNTDAWGAGLVGSIVFSDDGLRLFVGNQFGPDVAQYTLSTPYDLSSVTYDTTVSLFGFAAIGGGIRFSNDGTQLFAASLADIQSYSLGTAFDLSTLNTTSTAFYDFSSDAGGGVQSFEFSDDGTTLFAGVIPGNSSTPSIQYSLGTAFDLTTMSLDDGVEVVFEHPLYDLDFSDDGLSFFVLLSEHTGLFVAQYTCSTAFDIAGAAPTLVEFNLSDSGAATTDDGPMRFSADGTKMFVRGQSPSTVFQFSLSAAFDPSTASYDSVSHAFSGSVSDFAFSNAGTKVITTDGNGLKQFSLGSAYDLSSVTEDAVSYSFDGGAVFDSQRFAFNNDGTKLYVGCYDASVFQPAVAEYTLGTAFRLDSVTFQGFVAQGAWDGDTPYAPLLFSHDGSRLFSISSFRVIELFLPIPYDVSSGVVVENSFTANSEFPNGLRGAAFSASGDKMLLTGDDVSFSEQVVISYVAQSTDLPLVVFPSNFEFPGGTAPSGPATTGQTSLFSLSTSDEGTTFLCHKIGDFS